MSVVLIKTELIWCTYVSLQQARGVRGVDTQALVKMTKLKRLAPIQTEKIMYEAALSDI